MSFMLVALVLAQDGGISVLEFDDVMSIHANELATCFPKKALRTPLDLKWESGLKEMCI
jgi:hypothetical protein